MEVKDRHPATRGGGLFTVGPYPRCGSGGGARRCEPDRHVFDSSHEVGIKTLRRAGLIQSGQPLEHFVEHHPQFQPREIGAQTEMFAMAQSQMLVGGGPDIIPLRWTFSLNR